MCLVEGAGELHLTAGDVIDQVEQLDSEWYLGTLRGVTGFFPINYVKEMVSSSTCHVINECMCSEFHLFTEELKPQRS